MFCLIAPLMFMGLSSPTYCVSDSGNAENKKSREHFITLRDYDFVGPDPTLAARLAARMAGLRAPLDLSDLEARAPLAPPARAPWRRWRSPDLLLQPDYLSSRVKLPQLVNVSLDYAEMLNKSEFIEANALRPPFGPTAYPVPSTGAAPVRGSGVALVPSPGAGLVPSPGAALGPGHKTPLFIDPGVLGYEPGKAPDPYEGPAPGPYANPGPGASVRTGPVDTRRHFDHWNSKVLDLMKHNIYGTQLKIMEINDVIKQYENDPRFRMAYIYNRLDEWKKNLRTMYYAMYRKRQYPLRVKRLIWYYEHSLRIDIDVTYSIEYLVYLHTELLKNMDVILPVETRLELKRAERAQKMEERMKKTKMILPGGS